MYSFHRELDLLNSKLLVCFVALHRMQFKHEIEHQNHFAFYNSVIIQYFSGNALQDEDITETLEDIAENNASSESEAPISERAASGYSESPSIGSPRVQFEKIREEDDHVMSSSEAGDDDRKGRRHHKHDHKSVYIYFFLDTHCL